MTSLDHLSEEARHGIADGSLAPQHRADAMVHIGQCHECADDVARLERFVKNARGVPPAVADDAALDDVWRGIHAGIEQRKIVPLQAPDAGAVALRPETGRRRWIAGIAAAIVVVAATALLLRTQPTSGEDLAMVSGPTLTTVAESTQVYEHEMQTLLAELELRRALLRPETMAAVDRNLRVIDQAIAELREAVAHDPNNPALRRLLASSYRQKVELLKRVGNAG